MKEMASFGCSACLGNGSSLLLLLLAQPRLNQRRVITRPIIRIRALRTTSQARRKPSSNSSWKAIHLDTEAVGVPTSVPVRVAHELLLAGHRYLDVRTPEEFSAGHAPGAVNIPYMYSVGSGMTKNPHFVEEVSSHFRKEDEIIVGCQSGKRSMMAATDLLAAGFSCITDMAGGHATWAQNSLPLEL